MSTCPSCNKEIDNETKFCPFCGAKLENSNLSQNSSINSQEGANKSLGKNPKKKRNIIIVCAVALVVIIACIVGYLVYQNQLSHQEIDLSAPILSEDFDEENSSKIPVEISGKDLDNKDVNKVYYVDSKGNGIKLKQGNYSVKFPASPLCKNGCIYKVSESEITLNLDGSRQKFGSNDKCTYTKIDPLEVSDDDINMAYEYAKKDESCDKDLDAYKDATIKARDEAIAADAEKKAKEAEEKKKAEEAELEKKIRKAILGDNPTEDQIQFDKNTKIEHIYVDGDLVFCTVRAINMGGRYGFNGGPMVLKFQSDGSLKRIHASGEDLEIYNTLIGLGFSSKVAKEIEKEVFNY
ncbi:MAG: zinc ribbon domain-containing protein [Coriobacteriales bacterium]|nr:zinc ribbon domain-containing protein [Coriobacteriales bacterium]